MATATAGGSSKDYDGAAPDTKGEGAEVISVDGNDEDCGVNAGSLLAAIMRLQWRWNQQLT